MTLRRTLLVPVLVAGATLLTTPAQAAPGDALAEASGGAATLGGAALGPVAPCTTDGVPSATEELVSLPDVATFADTRSECSVDPAGELATASVTGGRFRLDVLRRYGGPRIRLAWYRAHCATTRTGSTAWFSFAGLAGVETPATIPPNHVVTVPGGPDGRPLATVTFNETARPPRPDGGMTVHLMHVRLFPEGGPARGEVHVGTVHCVPV